jgi:enamine deaminase RidA (YjgF/YER057c/UK114 family)
MPIHRITTPDVAEAEAGLWSNCLVVDKMVYLAGMTARGKDLSTIEGRDEYEQSKAIFQKYEAFISAAGGKMSDIVKLTIFVTDITKRQKVWQARREFFTGDFPTCALVEVSNLASPEILVEIQGIAHLGAT